MPKQELDLLGGGDVGQIRFQEGRKKGTGPIGHRELRNERIAAVMTNRVSHLAERLQETILETDPLQPVIQQLATPNCLHSFSLVATPEIVEAMSQSVTATQSIKEFEVSNSSVKPVARAIVYATKILHFEAKTPNEILLLARNALLGLRNLSALDDATLLQLLLVTQTGPNLSMEGLGKLFAGAGNALLEAAQEQQLPPDLIDRVIKPLEILLAQAPDFIKIADRARVPSVSKTETEAEVSVRAGELAKLMAWLTSDYLTEAPRNPIVYDTCALNLVESIFAHRVHWTNCRETITTLCQELIKKGWTDVASQVLLHARLSGLLPDATEALYANLELQHLYKEHLQQISAQLSQYQFIREPQKAFPGKRKIALYLGTFNCSHLGHRLLAYGGWRTLREWFPAIPMLISLNQTRPPKTAPLSVEESILVEGNLRAAMMQNNFRGLPADSFFLTSIDKIVGSGLDAAAKMQAFLQQTGLKGTRVCGYDRLFNTPPETNPVIIALRGLDLRELVSNPSKITEIGIQFPDQDITFLILTGATNITSTLCLRDASKANQGDVAALTRLRNNVHPANVNLVLAAAKNLEKRVNPILV